VQRNYYEILGVPVTATAEEIKARYRKLARWYHPDYYADLDVEMRNLAEARMREVNEAYQVLGDAARRARYDRANGFDPGTVATDERSFQSWDEARIEGVFASAEEMRRYTGFAYGSPATQRRRGGQRITFSRLSATRSGDKRIRLALPAPGPALGQHLAAMGLIVLSAGIGVLAVVLFVVALQRGATRLGLAAEMVAAMLCVSLLLASIGIALLSD